MAELRQVVRSLLPLLHRADIIGKVVRTRRYLLPLLHRADPVSGAVGPGVSAGADEGVALGRVGALVARKGAATVQSVMVRFLVRRGSG